MVHREARWTSLRMCMLAAALLMALLAGGCAKVSIKPKTFETPAPAAPAAPEENVSSEAQVPRLSLSAIVNRDLQNGHYAEGEKALRRYLQDHPGDRAAQFFLRQLTEDPKKLLGDASTPHIVQRGESYSTLAAKYLGDPHLFLALSRYNGSSNPSLLRVGSALKLPRFAASRSKTAGSVIRSPEKTISASRRASSAASLPWTRAVMSQARVRCASRRT